MAKQEIKKSTPQPDNSSRSVELIELEQELTTINPQIFQGVTPKKKEEILMEPDYKIKSMKEILNIV